MSKILITGICGSLGKSFVRLLKDDHHVFGYDNCEWSVAEFQEEFPSIPVVLGDFSEWKFAHHPCDIVIACAAYKHLPLGERNVSSFIDNNIIKLRSLFREASWNQADVIFISSDKAVEPINLYGMTKAVGEYIAKEYGGYVARCGNFLESSGSVIPVWEKAIREKKPIKITDRKMRRFVIDPDYAAEQIWEGYKAGDHLIIPKCKEIKISYLLKMVMARHRVARFPKPIVTGIRPGEKLREKLRWDWE